MKRARSYQDLSPEEKERYDRLRAIEKRLMNDRGGVRAKRCGSRNARRKKITAAANAMLGLEREPDLRVERVNYPGDRSPWVGSTTQFLGGSR